MKYQKDNIEEYKKFRVRLGLIRSDNREERLELEMMFTYRIGEYK